MTPAATTTTKKKTTTTPPDDNDNEGDDDGDRDVDGLQVDGDGTTEATTSQTNNNTSMDNDNNDDSDDDSDGGGELLKATDKEKDATARAFIINFKKKEWADEKIKSKKFQSVAALYKLFAASEGWEYETGKGSRIPLPKKFTRIENYTPKRPQILSYRTFLDIYKQEEDPSSSSYCSRKDCNEPTHRQIGKSLTLCERHYYQYKNNHNKHQHNFLHRKNMTPEEIYRGVVNGTLMPEKQPILIMKCGTKNSPFKSAKDIKGLPVGGELKYQDSSKFITGDDVGVRDYGFHDDDARFDEHPTHKYSVDYIVSQKALDDFAIDYSEKGVVVTRLKRLGHGVSAHGLRYYNRMSETDNCYSVVKNHVKRELRKLHPERTNQLLHPQFVQYSERQRYDRDDRRAEVAEALSIPEEDVTYYDILQHYPNDDLYKYQFQVGEIHPDTRAGKGRRTLEDDNSPVTVFPSHTDKVGDLVSFILRSGWGFTFIGYPSKKNVFDLGRPAFIGNATPYQNWKNTLINPIDKRKVQLFEEHLFLTCQKKYNGTTQFEIRVVEIKAGDIIVFPAGSFVHGSIVPEQQFGVHRTMVVLHDFLPDYSKFNNDNDNDGKEGEGRGEEEEDGHGLYAQLKSEEEEEEDGHGLYMQPMSSPTVPSPHSRKYRPKRLHQEEEEEEQEEQEEEQERPSSEPSTTRPHRPAIHNNKKKKRPASGSSDFDDTHHVQEKEHQQQFPAFATLKTPPKERKFNWRDLVQDTTDESVLEDARNPPHVKNWQGLSKWLPKLILGYKEDGVPGGHKEEDD